MARVLIFYSPFGSGHLSASRALASAFDQINGSEAVVEDIFNHVGSLLRGAVVTLYEQLSARAPLLYEIYYTSTDTQEVAVANTSNLFTDALYTPFLIGLNRYVERLAPDVIVCTQQFPLAAISFLKQQGRITQPIYVVVTDFMVHATWIAPEVSGYFVAHPQTGYVLAQRGVPADCIHVTGIPVNLELTKPKTSVASRRACNLPLDRPVISLLAGGLETKRVRLIVERMLSENRVPATLVTVAGRNQELADALRNFNSSPSLDLRKLGRIDYLDDLIVASDVVITKAGGLIVSEALARGTPLVIINPIPGQEEWNADFVSSEGVGLQLRMPEMVPTATLALLNSPERLAQMSQRAADMGRPRAALDIAQYVLDEIASRR